MKLDLEHLVLDYNGTLAVDGTPVTGVREYLRELSNRINIHVITADTFGSVQKKLEDVPCSVHILSEGNQDTGKLDYIKKLGAHYCVSIGNGRNDHLMLRESGLGIAVIQKEGAAALSLQSADIVCTCILDALELLNHPLRLTATLRQ